MPTTISCSKRSLFLSACALMLASYGTAASKKSSTATGEKPKQVASANYYSAPAAPERYSAGAQVTSHGVSNHGAVQPTASYNYYDQAVQPAVPQQPARSTSRVSSLFRKPSNVSHAVQTHQPAMSTVSYDSKSSRYTGLTQTGKASWYGSDFHGGKTANGERYNMESLTAAHRTLPFGTQVKVTNLHNGRECVVRINNRGPFLKGRILDLSKAAAREIGMISRGVANVQMQVLSYGQ